jgi:Kef-type K+ transport system membrane component KefB
LSFAIRVGGVILLCWLAGIVSTYPSLGGKTLGVSGLGLSIAITSLYTFLMFYGESKDTQAALTAAFFVLYLGFYIIALVPGAAFQFTTQDSFFHALWGKATWVLIVIIGFYYGGRTVEKVIAKHSE